MQDDQENMNTEENNLQTTTENNNNEPQYSIPQYSVPQYSVPQYSVPQYQEAPQNIIINNIQAYQQPTYPSNIPQPIVQQQNANLVQNQVQIQKEAGGGPNSWELFSFLSWILFIAAKWDLYRRAAEGNMESGNPITYNRSFVYFVNLIISVLGFLVYIKNIVYKKNENLYQALFGQFSKYHCISFVCYSALAFTLERGILNATSRISDSYNQQAFVAFYMIFSIFTLGSIMFVYYCTDMNCDWYIIMTIKKGVYSVIIAETTHNFFESIFYTRFVNISKNTQLVSLYQTGGIFFCILIFAIVCGFAIFKKDIILVALNFLIYCGITFKFFISGLNEDIGDGIGIICCIILVAQIGIMAFMIIKFQEQLLES